MHGPATVGWLLVALCAVTGAYCVLRARGTDGARRAEAGGEALMGFGMAAMAVPAVWTWQPLPPAVTAAVFATLFAALLVRELWLLFLRWRHGGRHGGWRGGLRGARSCGALHHAVGASAMVYMSLAMAGAFAGAGAMGGMGGAMAHGAGAGSPVAHAAGAGGVPVLTGALLVYFAGYVLWNGARLMPVPAGGTAGAGGAAVAGGAAGAAPGSAAWSVVHEPGVAAGCRLAMGTAMFAMLLTV